MYYLEVGTLLRCKHLNHEFLYYDAKLDNALASNDCRLQFELVTKENRMSEMKATIRFFDFIALWSVQLLFG